jgi:hypothetical protein
MCAFSCSLCEYSSKRRYNLERHFAAVHVCCDNANNSIASPNVSLASPNVSLASPNVSLASPNVSLASPNVSNNCETRFQCTTCCKSFAKKCSLDIHVSKCVGVQNSLTCPLCKKTFGTRQAKSKHIKICKGAIQGVTQPTERVPCTAEYVLPVGAIIAETANIQNMHNTYNMQNIHITLNGFGSEDETHITKQFQDARLMEFNGRGIYNYAKAVSFNPEKPENHNIRKRDQKFCNVYENGEWVIKSLTSMMADVVNMYQNKLRERLLDSDFKLTLDCETTWLQICENFMKFDRNKNPCDYYRIIRDIVALLENLENKYSDNKIIQIS